MTEPHLLDSCRASAIIVQHLERCQIFLQSLLSVDPRSTIRSPVSSMDYSLQSRLVFPHVIRGRFAYFFPLLHFFHHGTIHLCWKRLF